jgi:hypothetical protein
MNMIIEKLELVCRRSTEIIPFGDFSYFYGEIGSGKSTIARLIDYCFGGSLVETPAIQSEFISATLYLLVEGNAVQLTRDSHSNQIEAVWGPQDQQEQALLPARTPSGEVIPNTGVENLSDFLYFLSGVTPPRVRRSQTREDSGLERLSFRDLYWYCYLDQDEIDSNFFHLDREADTFKRLKSRNVLRFIVGFHQERVAELEMDLERSRRERIRNEDAANVLEETLREAELSTEMEITERVTRLQRQSDSVRSQIEEVRSDLTNQRNHAVDSLRHQGQRLAAELRSIEDALSQVDETIGNDRRHLHEILNLSTKVKRIAAARAVLNDVEFERCPRCMQDLPSRGNESCHVCGQLEPTYEQSESYIDQTEADMKNRISELEESISKQEDQRDRLKRRQHELQQKKSTLDEQLNVAMQQYDSAFLSAVLERERRLAAIEQEIQYLERLKVLPARVSAMRDAADRLTGRERRIREELKGARDAAERDTRNVRLLADLFLDCLVKAQLPGFTSEDNVQINSTWFLPEIISPQAGELATIAFDTLGSGGMKTIFKCCFALAIHRLVVSIGAMLPNILIIDSPMKNISERENRTQFQGFHQLLYELASGELSDTQFILIDKEYCPPKRPDEFGRNLKVRHMKVDDDNEPPLITYYRDHPKNNEGST